MTDPIMQTIAKDMMLDAAATIDRQAAEIQCLQAEREQYNLWAREIKVNVEEMRQDNERLRAALKEAGNKADDIGAVHLAAFIDAALEQKADDK